MQYLFMLLFAAGAVGLDQFVKYLTVANIAEEVEITAIPGLMNLTYYKNTGASFSMLEGQQYFFIAHLLTNQLDLLFDEGVGQFRRGDAFHGFGTNIGIHTGTLHNIRINNTIIIALLELVRKKKIEKIRQNMPVYSRKISCDFSIGDLYKNAALRRREAVGSFIEAFGVKTADGKADGR